jgi:hypothetical protein
VILDTDSDSVSNGIEFALGTHPRINDNALHGAYEYYDNFTGMMLSLPALPPLPSYSFWVAPHTVQTYKSYLTSGVLTGVTCNWEISPDLATWTPAPLTMFSSPIRAEGYMYQATTPAVWNAGFFRILVTTD